MSFRNMYNGKLLGERPARERRVIPVYDPTLSSGTPRRGKLNNPILSDIPLMNTTLIPPPIRMGEKEIRFADMVWAGLTPYIAYRDTYGWPNWIDRDTLYSQINERLWSRGTRLRIHQLDKMACDMDTKTAENRRNFVLDGLTELASDDSISPMARLKALELLGKVRGTDLFSDRVEHVASQMSEEQVKAALAEKLAQLGAGSLTGTSDLAKDIKVIEHVATPVSDREMERVPSEKASVLGEE